MNNSSFSSFTLTRYKSLLLQIHPLTWIFAVLVVVGSWFMLPEGGFDWRNDIGPGIPHWWPSQWDEGLIMAPWGAMILSPLGGLPDRIATALTNGVSVIIFALVAKKLGGPTWIAIPVLVSPPGYWLFQNGQSEWIILTGLLLFNGFDVLLLTLKPQVALGAIIPRLKKSGDKWKEYLLPSIVVFTISLIVWPLWPLKIFEIAPILTSGNWNSALWPWGIPLGIFFLWYSWKTADDRWGVAATPFYSHTLICRIIWVSSSFWPPSGPVGLYSSGYSCGPLESRSLRSHNWFMLGSIRSYRFLTTREIVS